MTIENCFALHCDYTVQVLVKTRWFLDALTKGNTITFKREHEISCFTIN